MVPNTSHTLSGQFLQQQLCERRVFVGYTGKHDCSYYCRGVWYSIVAPLDLRVSKTTVSACRREDDGANHLYTRQTDER